MISLLSVAHTRDCLTTVFHWFFACTDTFIQRTKKLYLDTRTQRNIDLLSQEVNEVHAIMTRNIQDVLGLGERLDRTWACLFGVVAKQLLMMTATCSLVKQARRKMRGCWRTSRRNIAKRRKTSTTRRSCASTCHWWHLLGLSCWFCGFDGIFTDHATAPGGLYKNGAVVAGAPCTFDSCCVLNGSCCVLGGCFAP